MKIILAIALLFPSQLALADQFAVFNLTTDNRTFLGLSSTGTAYFAYTSFTCGPSYTCYFAYSNGTLLSISSVAPTFTLDNGTPCKPATSSGTRLINGICNNGLDAYSAVADLYLAHLYWGTAFEDIWGQGFSAWPALIAMNHNGDIVFDDQAYDYWYEAIDLTTSPHALLAASDPPAIPEPWSFVLVATGLVCGVFRKYGARTRTRT